MKRKIVGLVMAFAIALSLLCIPGTDTYAAGRWKSDAAGWWYEESDGSYAQAEWKQLDGIWYYFNNSGYMCTGWQKIDSVWYYFYSDGSMAADKWVGDYYLNSSGAWTDSKVNSDGWQLKNGKWYCYNSDGSPKTGWVKSGRDWYYLNSDGGSHTGWLYDGGYWYYMDSDGKMCVDWIWDGKWYLLDASGRWINEDKIIYLTFDDGPGPYTDRLLTILDKYNVKATFFVTGAYPSYSYCIGKAYNAGHSIGVHTYTHNYNQIYASESAYWSDFEKIQNLIASQTGSRTNLVRFPGGSSNMVSKINPGIMTRLTKSMNSRGYTYFDWNVISGDAGETTCSTGVYNYMVKGVQSHTSSVVLCHDIKSYTVDAMEYFIPWAQSNGYTFLPLTTNSPTAHQTVQN